MSEQALADAVSKTLNQRSIVFREKTRFQNQKSFPFFYSFLPYPFQQGVVAPNTGFTTLSAANAEGPDGYLVTAGATLSIAVQMHRDCNYHLLWARYSAWFPGFTAPGEGSRELLVAPQTALQAGRTQLMASDNQRIPYLDFLDVSVFLLSVGGRELYGGTQNDALNPNLHRVIPLPVHSLQKAENGIGQVRTSYLLPASGVVSLRITNNFTEDLRVTGHLFGYKVPL